MGNSVEVAAEAVLRRTRRRKWVLDPATGQIRPDQGPMAEPEVVRAQPEPPPRPAPVIQAAYRTYD